MDALTLALAGLDPGIASDVARVRKAGFHTTDSGDGVSKPDGERAFDVPHICVQAKAMDAQIATEEARRLGLLLGSGWAVECSWRVDRLEPIMIIATRPTRESQ